MAQKKCLTTISYNGRKATLLSWTSDMDAWSFSLPAGQPGSCPGMVADSPDNICHGCYAQINRYNMPNVLEAQWVRFNWLRSNLRGSTLEKMAGMRMIEDTFVGAIRKYCTNGYFRGHDAGDFFNADYAWIWYAVATRCKDIKFWFPTRSHRVPAIADVLSHLAALPNVTVRPSALIFNELAPRLEGFSKGTGVVTDPNLSLPLCPKTVHGGTCESNQCRTCWVDEREVYYRIHGYLGKSKIANAFSDNIVRTRNKISQPFIKLTISGA